MNKFTLMVVALVLGVSVLWFYRPTNQVPVEADYELPKSAHAVQYKSPLKCMVERVYVKAVGPVQDVVGSNYLKAYRSDLRTSLGRTYPVHLVVATEGVWAEESPVGVVTNCETIKPDDLKALKSSQTEISSMGVWFWDRENYQVSRQDALLIGEYVYLEFSRVNKKTQ